MHLAIATSRDYANYHCDDAALIAALPALGMHPVPCVWNDPTIAWEAFDAVLIRTVWDYFEHYPQFLAWLNRLQVLGVRTVNPLPILRWNADKRYLLALEGAAVPIVDTRICAAHELLRCIAHEQWPDVVVKPTVSGGALHTVRGTPGESRFVEQLQALPQHLTYLIQPFEARIAQSGEWSLFYFGGAFSHAVLKRPAAGDFRVQQRFGGSVELAAPDARLLGDGLNVLSAVQGLGLGRTMYARIDGVAIDGRLVLIEAELIEPQLFLQLVPQAATRFARHLHSWLHAAGTPGDPTSIGL